MATLTTQSITRAGITPTFAAANAGGDACAVGKDIFLAVVNGGGGSINVTLAIPSGSSSWPGVTYTNTVVAVGAGVTKWIGPLEPPLYMDPTTGLCTITYSGVTTVTVGCFQNQEP